MKKSSRGSLSYANVTATLALFVALGGSSYAAIAVDGRDVADESLTGVDIRDGSLTRAEFRGPLADAARRRGRRGPRGRRGAPGSSGATNVVVRTAPMSVAECFQENCPGGTFEVEALATCQMGERVTGGGVQSTSGTDPVVTFSRPHPATAGAVPTGWSGGVRFTVEPGPGPRGYTTPQVWALCAAP